MKIHIGPKPYIHVNIEVRKEIIVKISLSSSQSFVCTFNESSESQEAVLTWLKGYSCGQSPPLPAQVFDWTSLTPLMRKFLPKLADIGFGESISYGELGKKVGGHPRGIGQLCKHNPFPLFYPCHRVLGANQCLGGFNFGLEPKISLLNFENIKFMLKNKKFKLN